MVSGGLQWHNAAHGLCGRDLPGGQASQGLRYRLRMNLRFDLKTLQLFLSVVELQNLTKAAEREHIATSAISKRISDLELALGATLLHRQARGVEPTAAGLALATHARTVISSIERLTGELADYSNGSKGHVRITANRSSVITGLPEDIRTFIDTHPDVKIDLQEDNSPTVLRNVLDGRADIGVFTLGHTEQLGLETFEYRRDQLIVIAPESHPLSACSSLRFAELLEYDIVNLQSVTAWDDLLNRAAARAGAHLRVRYRVASFEVACRLVAAGLGVAMAPSGVLDNSRDPRLKGIRLDEEWAERQHMIGVRSTALLSAPAQAMVRHLLL